MRPCAVGASSLSLVCSELSVASPMHDSRFKNLIAFSQHSDSDGILSRNRAHVHFLTNHNTDLACTTPCLGLVPHKDRTHLALLIGFKAPSGEGLPL
ncbi:hypothetical protein EDD18DRAFT_1166374 [Armillaria luteobubalina]|uniref:Uncharacterized protein n=1 Tax=Armillaria luteobubalina TaxID=153913 RepID=A0AA39UWZ5_9AGAR|nr:hypothetical protein EDD18DRAFT_1166374 [Armillaria luteobubalina]